jgi:hypothetical protein
MKDVIDLIAKTLCESAATHSGLRECSFCEQNKGKCDPKMWKSFRHEAKDVYNILTIHGHLSYNKKKMLPGLGG